MIYILHGEDVSASRNFILKLHGDNNVQNKIEVSILDIVPEDLLISTTSIDLFGGSSMVVFDVTKAGRMNVAPFIEVLTHVPKENILVIYSQKDLSKANKFIKNASNTSAKVVNFKKSAKPNIFAFSELVFNKDRKGSYKELNKLLREGTDPFYIFAMLMSGLRNIGIMKFNSPLSEKLHPFVKSKMKRQVTMFTESEIRYLYAQFYNLDHSVKTGGVSPELLVPFAIEKVLNC